MLIVLCVGVSVLIVLCVGVSVLIVFCVGVSVLIVLCVTTDTRNAVVTDSVIVVVIDSVTVATDAIVWHAVWRVCYTCVLYFCICTCSAQLSVFHMERQSRSTMIIIVLLR